VPGFARALSLTRLADAIRNSAPGSSSVRSSILPDRRVDPCRPVRFYVRFYIKKPAVDYSNLGAPGRVRFFSGSRGEGEAAGACSQTVDVFTNGLAVGRLFVVELCFEAAEGGFGRASSAPTAPQSRRLLRTISGHVEGDQRRGSVFYGANMTDARRPTRHPRARGVVPDILPAAKGHVPRRLSVADPPCASPKAGCKPRKEDTNGRGVRPSRVLELFLFPLLRESHGRARGTCRASAADARAGGWRSCQKPRLP